MRGRQSPEQLERWTTIKREFVRVRSLGGAEDDPAVRIGGQLSILAERVESITSAVKAATAAGVSRGAESEQLQLAQQSRMIELMTFAQQQARASAPAMPTVAPPTVAPPSTAAPGLEWARPQIARIASALETLGQAKLAIQVTNEAPPGITELLAQQVSIVERTLVPLVCAATGNLQDVRNLEVRVDQMLGMLQDIDEVLKGKYLK